MISNFSLFPIYKISNLSLWRKQKSGSNQVGLTHFQLWHPDSCSADLTLIYSHTVAKPLLPIPILLWKAIFEQKMFHTHHLTCMSHSLNKNWITFHNNARISSWVYLKIYYNWSLWSFFSMIRNNKLFSCDEVVVILVEGNKEMSAMIV